MPLSSSSTPATFRGILTRNLVLPLALGVASAVVFVSLLVYLADVVGRVQRSDELLTQASTVQKLDLDMESGLRGFLLNGDERFLAPYDAAAMRLEPAMQQLKQQVGSDGPQLARLRRIEQLQAKWRDYANDRMAQKRRDPLAPVSASAGRELKDQARAEFDEFFAVERRARADRIETANRNVLVTALAFVLFMLGVGGLIAWRGRKDLMGLSASYEASLEEQNRQAAILQSQAWLREGQSIMSERIGREQDLGAVGHAALEFLSQYIDVKVGALYLPEPPGFVRVATWGWPASDGSSGSQLPQDRTLLAECAAQRRRITLDPVPPG
ncbi:MAG TPA: CHASE3 domain-containing protein, partial [Solimonas sp.]|nr:CHASE3 domain-containing protein [Solimonas sp.]